MIQLTQFDKASLNYIRQDVNAALQEVAKKYGMTLRLGNIRFNAKTFTAKLEASMLGDGGEVVTKEMRELMDRGKWVLGQDFDINKVYDMLGRKIQFVGLALRRSKYPVIYKDLNSGKMYKTSQDQARYAVEHS